MLSEGFLLLKKCNQMLDKRKFPLLPHPRGERYDWLISGREAPWRVETGWAPQLNEHQRERYIDDFVIHVHTNISLGKM